MLPAPEFDAGWLAIAAVFGIVDSPGRGLGVPGLCPLTVKINRGTLT